MKKDQRGVISIVVIGLVVALIVGAVVYGVLKFNNDGSVDAENSITSSSSSVSNSDSTSSEYPDLYKQYGLPEYPGATITDDGRTSDSLSDGISLTLKTSDGVQEVGSYYANKLEALAGWEYTPPRFSNDTLYGGTAKKADENLTYQFTVTKLPNHTQISISFLEF